MTPPVVWTPEANEDLLAARAWYDNIRPQLGERFALAVEATVEDGVLQVVVPKAEEAKPKRIQVRPGSRPAAVEGAPPAS